MRGLERPPWWATVTLVVGTIALVVLGVMAGTRHYQDPASPAQVRQWAARASAAQASASAAQEAARPKRIAFLGDSYTVGARATDTSKRWTSLFCADLGCIELNDGISDTGYAVAGTQPNGAAYGQRIAAVAAQHPDIVVVSGGRNDLNAPDSQVAPAVAATFADLRSAVPGVRVVAISPFWGADQPPARLGVLASEVRDGVAAIGGVYLDAGQPLAGHPELMAPDGIHPDDAGYRALADAVEAAWKASPLTAG